MKTRSRSSRSLGLGRSRPAAGPAGEQGRARRRQPLPLAAAAAPRATPPATASRPPCREEATGRSAGSRPVRWRGRWPRRRRSSWARCAARAPAAGSSAATSRHSSRASPRRRSRAAAGAAKPASSGPAATPRLRSTTATTGPSAPPLAAQRIPHTRMRKTIAQRMLQAKQAAPEIHLTVDVRVDRLVAAREEINKHLAREGIKISLGDFVTKAVALALRLHPGLNASFEPDAIVRHGEVNIGIAVALDEGLIVPVLHNADTLGLARDPRPERGAGRRGPGRIRSTGEQLTGGTFTISNLGMYGTRQFDAILNLPEVGILAVGAAEKRPVVEGDQLTVGTVMTAHPDRRPPRRRRRHGRRISSRP